MNYLLDTCVISDFFKKIPSVVDHFQKLTPDQLYISSITVMEIEYGLLLHAERERKIRPLWEDVMRALHVIPFSHLCAAASATLRARTKRLGISIGPYDILIAGTAMAHNMCVVTSNLREFMRISDISVEDWRYTH
jgi:tRNA(fMet)-specific endonuclease VapC